MDDAMNLIAEYSEKHPLALECGSEYIMQDDKAQVERELITKIESMTPEQFYRFIMTVCGAYLRQETAPVVHGRWVEYMPFLGAGDLQSHCSACGLTNDVRTPYCPNCGARMDGGKDDAKA